MLSSWSGSQLQANNLISCLGKHSLDDVKRRFLLIAETLLENEITHFTMLENGNIFLLFLIEIYMINQQFQAKFDDWLA